MKEFLPASDSKEIAGDWHRLVESIQLMVRLGLHGRLANWQAASHNRKRRGDVEVKGGFNIRSVLTREDRPGVNCLALGD